MGKRSDATRGLGADTRGATTLEYLILVGMVVVVALGAWRALGDGVRGTAEQQAACLDALDGSGCRGVPSGDEANESALDGRDERRAGAASEEVHEASGTEDDPDEPGMRQAVAALLLTTLCVGDACVGVGDADAPAPLPVLPPAPIGPLFTRAAGPVVGAAGGAPPLAPGAPGGPLQAALARVTGRADLVANGDADAVARALVAVAFDGKAATVVDALLEALREGGGRERETILAALGWAGRGLDAEDERVAAVHAALRAALERGGADADGAVRAFEALFDRLLPEDQAALAKAARPDAAAVLAAADARMRQLKEQKAKLEAKLKSGQTLSYEDLRAWMGFADAETAKLIGKYLSAERGGGGGGADKKTSAADKAAFDGWEAFPFDPPAAAAMARMLGGEPLDAGQQRALFEAMKGKARAIRGMEKEYPRFGSKQMPREVASAHFAATFALDRYLDWRKPRDKARLAELDDKRVAGTDTEAADALRDWAVLTKELIELLVDADDIRKADAARERGMSMRREDLRDRRWDDSWNAMVGDEADKHRGLVGVQVLDLEARLRRTVAGLDADTRAGKDTSVARFAAAADLQRRLAATRAALRKGLEYLKPRMGQMTRVPGFTAVREAVAQLEAAEDKLQKRVQPAIDALRARPTAELFRVWGVHPTEQNRLAALADARYGAPTVALIAGRVRMVNTLPPPLRQELTGSAAEVDPIQVAQQLATGTLDHEASRNRFLFQPLEKKLLDLRLAEQARVRDLKDGVVKRTGWRDVFAGGLAGNTKGGLGFWPWLGSLGGAADDWEKSEGRSVDLLRKQEGDIQAEFAKLQAASGRLLFLDLAEELGAWQRLRDGGRLRDADFALFHLWKKHGDAMVQIDAALLPELREAWKRLHAEGSFATKELPELATKDAGARRAEALALLRGLDPKKSDTEGVRAYALANLDRDPGVGQLQKLAGEAAGRLQTMMKLLGAAQEGTKYQPLVDYVREDLARPLVALYDAPETKQAIADTKALIAELREAQKKLTAEDKVGRNEIGQRIVALEAMVKLADNAGVREALKIIMDKSKFNADTVANWVAYEGPKVVGAIAVATLAAVTIVATGGGAAPLWAIALGASVGGYVGYQATSESMFQLRNAFDPEVTSGKVKWGDRSTIGAYVKGDMVYDPVKNEHVKMAFGQHVLLPAVKEIAIGFVLNFATMGLGRLGSGYINAALSRAGGQSALLKQAARLRAVDARMASMAKATANNPAADALRKRLLAEVGKNFPRELLDEVKDEAVEAGLERVLGAVDQRLAPLAGLLNATGKGVKLDHGGRAEAMKAVVDSLRVEGFEVETELVDGKIRARMNGIELFIDGRGEVSMAEARGPPGAKATDADPTRQGAIRNPGDPIGEVANEYDLTAKETELLRELYGDLESVAKRIEADPVAAARDLHRLTGDPKWASRIPFNVTPALEITGSEIDRLKAQAKEYAAALKGEMTEAEILDHLVREKFTGILRANAGVGGTYNRHPVSGVVSIPEKLQVRRDGKTRDLDASDPVEGALARLHARALVEELTHGAGFSIRPGSYVPLSPRMADFQHWLRQPRTQEWLKQSFDAATIARLESMIYEADAMDLFVRHSKFTDSEVDRYDVRRAFQKFLDEGAPAAPPGTKTTPPVDGSLQGAISWWSRFFGGSKPPAKPDADADKKKETPPPVDPPAPRLGPDGKPEPLAKDAQGKDVGPDWYGTVYYGSSTETPEKLTPEKVFAEGLKARGKDRDLRRHVEATTEDSAFRGTTLVPQTPDGETGASLWAGPGGYVYEIDGMPGWDANKHLERIPVSGGLTRQNPVRGENEISILAEVPRERIKAAYQIIETPTGRIRLGPRLENPNYKAPGSDKAPAADKVQGAFDAEKAGKLRGTVDEVTRGRIPKDVAAGELMNVQALALDTVQRLFTNEFGTDTALLDAVRAKKPAFVRHGADPAAWGGRDTAAQQRAALLVLLHTFQGKDAGDVALRKAALDKLAEVGRPSDVDALLAMVRNPRTSTDLHHGLETIKAIVGRHGSPQLRGDAEVKKRVGALLEKKTLTDAERARVIEVVLQHGEIASIKQHKGKNMNEVYFVTFSQTVVGADGKAIPIRGVFKPENTYPGKEKSFFGREVSAYLFDRDFAGSGKVPVTVEAVLSAKQAPQGGPAPLGTGSMQFMIPVASPMGPSAVEVSPEYAFLVDDKAKSELSAEVQADMKKQLAEIKTLLFILNDPDKLPDRGGFPSPNYGNIMIAPDPKRPGFYALYMIDNGGGQGALGKDISRGMLPGEVPPNLAERLRKADGDDVTRLVSPWAGDAGGDVSRRMRAAVPAAKPAPK